MMVILDQIGQFLGRIQSLETKYNFEFSKEVIVADINRLTNQLWKLIPMREHEENWLWQLDNVIVEITGLYEIFLANPKFLVLLSKLEGLRSEVLFDIHRRTVFESISLLREIYNEK